MQVRPSKRNTRSLTGSSCSNRRLYDPGARNQGIPSTDHYDTQDN